MPIDSFGFDVKMSAVDMDPKTYSPMSGSDENMSSPPSILTTASAGSCTPSSLPSAGSTPSSVQSAGSTPYQFVTQEESTVIKPLTPSDNQSVHMFNSDQPVTPEPTVSSELSISDVSGYNDTKKFDNQSNQNDSVNYSNCCTANISDDVNERREDCPCIMCSDKPSVCVLPLTSEKVTDTLSPNPNPRIKEEKPISVVPVQEKSETVKHKRKSLKKAVHYESELSQGPESTSIRLKIKLTSHPMKRKKKSKREFKCIPVVENFHVDPVPSTKISKGTSKSKRKRSSCNTASLPPGSPALKNPAKRKPSASKPVENFDKWGPIEPMVNGQPQSGWACQLPKLVLEKIFLYATYSEGCIPLLTRLSRVCRLWREVSVYPVLWHSADLATGTIRPKFRNERKLLWLVQNRLTNVKELNLAGWGDAVTSVMLLRISQFCPKLLSLGLSNCTKLHSENIAPLLSSSPQLRSLDLSGIMASYKPSPRSAVGHQTIIELSVFLKDLNSLILANNTLTNVPGIVVALATNCSNLQVLDMSSVETVGQYSVRLDIEKLHKGCPKLRVLRLANSQFRLNQSSLSEQVSSPGFPELEELSLAVNDRDNYGMNDSELERVLRNSHKLLLLDIRRCRNITDSSLVRIPPWDLKYLFLSGGVVPKPYSDRLELVIRKWQHSLVEVDLSWTCHAESVDAALLAISEDKNDRLEVLNMCGSSVNFGPVQNVLKNCSQLRWLNLSSCRALPRGVKRLYETQTSVQNLQKSILDGRFDEPPPSPGDA